MRALRSLRPNRRRRHGLRTARFTLVELAAVGALLVVLAGVSLYFLRQRLRPRSAMSQCAANLRLLATAITVYAGDNGAVLPACGAMESDADGPALTETLATYLGTEKYWRCPADDRPGDEAGPSYLWNVGVNRARLDSSLTTLTGTQESPLILVDALPFHGGKGLNHARLDGTIETRPEPLFGGAEFRVPRQ